MHVDVVEKHKNPENNDSFYNKTDLQNPYNYKYTTAFSTMFHGAHWGEGWIRYYIESI